MRGLLVLMGLVALIAGNDRSYAGQPGESGPAATRRRPPRKVAKTLEADGRILARPTSPKDGVVRSMLVGTLVGKHVADTEVWDVRLELAPRTADVAVAPTPWHQRNTSGPILYELRDLPARLILRASSTGRTILGGTVLHDFGYGDNGILMDGIVRLHPIRKIRLNEGEHRGYRIHQLMTSWALEAPERVGTTIYLSPEARPPAAE
jgi:hypothetical protein